MSTVNTKYFIRGKFDMFLVKRIKFIKNQRNKSLKGPKSIVGCDYNRYTNALTVIFSYNLWFFLSSLSITLCTLFRGKKVQRTSEWNSLNRENDANCATFIFCTRIYNHKHSYSLNTTFCSCSTANCSLDQFDGIDYYRLFVGFSIFQRNQTTASPSIELTKAKKI